MNKTQPTANVNSTNCQQPKQNDLEKANAAQQQSRRSTIMRVSLVGATFAVLPAMPKKWVGPVVDTVVLPVHAQTSGSPEPAEPTDPPEPPEPPVPAITSLTCNLVGTSTGTMDESTITFVASITPAIEGVEIQVQKPDPLAAGGFVTLSFTTDASGSISESRSDIFVPGEEITFSVPSSTALSPCVSTVAGIL